MKQGTGCSFTDIQCSGLECAALYVTNTCLWHHCFIEWPLIIFSALIVVKPIYLRNNTVLLDSVVEIYKHCNTVETLLSYSGTKSLVSEWCGILFSIKNVITCFRKYHVCSVREQMVFRCVHEVPYII